MSSRNDLPNARASLRFLGAAGTVTGSRYLIEAAGKRILIDCGLFQGYKQLRERNWAKFPVAPASIDTVLLTHAHLDHAGYLPALVKQGFAGKILCTPATRDLSELLLPDSAHLQEEEARYAKKKGYSRHAEPQPLYTQEDAATCLTRFEARPFLESQKLAAGISARFIPAGHLLGAAQIALNLDGCRLHFTGDLGRPADVMLKPPAPFEGADVLVCESTYGNRRHPAADAEGELAAVIQRVAGRGGVIVIPAFAIGRAQGLMLHIARLRRSGRIPQVPVYLNSPMAIDATEIYHHYHDEHHVTPEECRDMFQLATMVRTVEQSKALNQQQGPMIIISASGMLTGGRVLHHVLAFGQDSRNAIVLAGFQAGGTRGAALVRGDRTLRIFGREVPIEAEVVTLESFSGHADSEEMLAWMRTASAAPNMTYITHGEPDAADALRGRIDHELGWRCRVPEQLERVSLDTVVTA
jgi:metallo-beta-lactamase family protein